MEEPAGGAAIRFRRAVGLVLTVEAAKDVGFRGPLHIVADEQIEQSVAVVVEPKGRSTESFALAQACGNRDINKGSFARIAKETILSNTSDKNVG